VRASVARTAATAAARAPRPHRPNTMSRFYRGGAGAGFAKPESALKRSQELSAVGQKGAALRVLHDVVSSKRHRTWSKALEDVALAYFDLCVDLRKGRYAKDGLIHYRNVCQQVRRRDGGWGGAGR